MEERTEKNEARSAPKLWDSVVRYLGVIVCLSGIALLLCAALLKEHYHLAAEICRDVGLAFLPLGIVSVIFERFARQHFIETLHQVVNLEMRRGTEAIASATIDKVVKAAFDKRLRMDNDSLDLLENSRKLGLTRVMQRSELEVSDISFANVTREILAANESDKEFLVVGKHLDFVARQIDTIQYGLEHGVQFRFMIASQAIPTYSRRENPSSQEESLRKLMTLQGRKNEKQWTGSLEVRRLNENIGASFSSFANQGKRVSVMNFNLGDDLHLRWAHVYENLVGQRNFASRLYESNKERFFGARLVLTLPNKFKCVYVYGIRGHEVFFVRKRGASTWELPGGHVEPNETLEEAARREFKEETGLDVDLVSSVDTNKSDTLAFVGIVAPGQVTIRDLDEVEEVKAFRIDDEPRLEALTFPETGYRDVLEELMRRLTGGDRI